MPRARLAPVTIASRRLTGGTFIDYPFLFVCKGTLLFACSSDMKDTCWEQREFGTTIHAPFQELEPVHMSLQRPLAPRQCQTCQHCSLVLSDAFGKRFELWQTAGICLFKPAIQSVSSPLSDHLHK